MAEYWIRVTVVTDRDVSDVTRLAAQLTQLAGLDADVNAIGVEVQRWDDDEDVLEDIPVPAGRAEA